MKTHHTGSAARSLIAVTAAMLMLSAGSVAIAQTEKPSTGAAQGGGVVANPDKGASKTASKPNVGAVQGSGVVVNRDKTAKKPKKKKKTEAAG